MMSRVPDMATMRCWLYIVLVDRASDAMGAEDKARHEAEMDAIDVAEPAT